MKLQARRISRIQNSNWIVTEYVKTHTCTSDDVDAGGSRIGNRIVGNIIKGKFLDGNRIMTNTRDDDQFNNVMYRPNA